MKQYLYPTIKNIRHKRTAIQGARVLAVVMLVVFVSTIFAPPAMALLDPGQQKIFKNDLQWFTFKDQLITNQACGATGGGGGPVNLNVGKDFSLGPLNDAKGRQVALMKALIRDYGLTPTQAAGILGNFMWESGGVNLPPDINEGPKPPGPPLFKGGYGWAQWTGPRQRTFIKFATDNGYMANSFVNATDAANYAYLASELGTGYRSTIPLLKKTTTTDDAVAAFESTYESAGKPRLGDRQLRAKDALAAFGGGGAPAATTTAPTTGTAAGDCSIPEGANCGTSQGCAQMLIDMKGAGKVVFQPGGETDLIKTAGGKPITNCGGSVTLNLTLLQLLIKLANGLQAQSPNYKLEIHNFVSQHGCDSGRHPPGRASDVNIAGVPGDTGLHLDTRADYKLPVNMAFAQTVMDNLPTPGPANSNGGLGQKQFIGPLNNTANKRYFNDPPNANAPGARHFHIDVGDLAK